jgi:DHA2 family multidrug resistance protein
MTTQATTRKLSSKWLIAVIVASAAFLETLDNSIGNVAVPYIAGNLSATMSQATWVLTSYIVANSVILPLSGWLSSVLGRKNYFRGSVVGFTVSSVLCGLAPNLGALVFFRVLQGLFGGGLLTASQAILADAFEPEELGTAMAIYGIAMIVGPIIGPLVGGWITDHASWRWIFFINLPMGLISAILVTLFVYDPPNFKRADLAHGLNFDFIGIALISTAIGAFQVFLDRGQELDWFASSSMTFLFVTSFIAAIAAVIWELREKAPVVDLRLLENRNVLCSSLVMFVAGMIVFGGSAIVPMFVQSLMGYSATLSGYTLAPGGAVCAICFPIVGILIAKGYLRWYVVGGLVITAYSMYMMEQGNLHMNMQYIIVSRMIMAAGLSLILLPVTVAPFAFVAKSKTDAVSGMTNLFRNMGGSVGISLLTVIVDRRMQFHQATLVQHMTPFDPSYQQMTTVATQALANTTGAVNAPHITQGILYGVLQQQSLLLAYIDAFHFLTIACIAVIPLALLLRSPKNAGSGPVVMH